MNIECMIFDFDGTLFDSMFIWENIGKVYLESLGKKAKSSLQEDLKTLSLLQGAKYLQKEYDLSQTIEQIIDGINNTVEHFYIDDVLPKEGVIDFLNQLQLLNIPMCIATASEYDHIKKALIRCKMNHYFNEIFTCSMIGSGKDEPIIYQKAMEYYHASHKTTLIFEDALHALQTAKKDGFKVIGVYDDSENEQIKMKLLSDYYLEDFKNTKELINKIKAGEI